MNRKQKIIISITGITIVLLALLSLTYGYYLTRIKGNSNTSSVGITTAKLKLEYSEGQDSNISLPRLMPGVDIPAKTFTVTNSGNGRVDNYVVAIIDLVNTLSRTEDLTYTLTCTEYNDDNDEVGTCNGVDKISKTDFGPEYPIKNSMLVTNSIEPDYSHVYSLKLNYVNLTNVNQSVDMGSTIAGKVQIFGLSDTIAITGEITDSVEGDYVQINSEQMTSQILKEISGETIKYTYKLVGIKPGTHSLKIMDKAGTVKTEKKIVINSGATASVSKTQIELDNGSIEEVPLITMSPESRQATIDINKTTNSYTTSSEIKENPFNKDTLAYKIVESAILSSEAGTEAKGYAAYRETPTTSPSQISAVNEASLSITQDDYGTSYYFRGNVKNNYIEFAGFYWRIVRINGDGSIRIIYDGTNAHENGSDNASRRVSKGLYNSVLNDNAYQGYMYGLAGTTTKANRCLMLENDEVVNKVSTYKTESACMAVGGKWTTTAYEATHANVKNSTIKSFLDNWYKINIEAKGYSDMVSDTLFCNDRSLKTGSGTGTKTTKYSANYRLLTNKNPNLKCPQKNDAFTVEDTLKGNGDLTYPIGLITADESSFAGGKYYVESGTSNNANYYLYKGVNYFTLTPYKFENETYYYNLINNGSLRGFRSQSEYGYVPVINLKAEIGKNIIGDGTMDNPYRMVSSTDILQLLNLTAKEEIPNFDTLAVTDEGIFKTEDDYGTSYYFRGASEYNYLKFAGFYWRIIRINGDGSLRILYDGTKAHANGENSADRKVSKSIFNSPSNDNAYQGYMYGLAGETTDVNRCLILEKNEVKDNVGTYSTEFSCEAAGGKWTTTAYEATHANVKDSTIKEVLDKWYKKYIEDKGYSDAISDTLFCNDRSIYSGTGIGTNTTKYSALNRLYTNKIPTLKCAQKNDAFTVDDKIGNGDLTYPIGLITADEGSFAGGRYYAADGSSDNIYYYLYKGENYWGMTPYKFYEDAYIFQVTDKSRLRGYRVYHNYDIAPVINLTSSYVMKLKGTGTMTDPFVAS